MNFPHDLEKAIFLQNNSPVTDFLGLTPREVHFLVYEPYSESSPVRLRSEIESDTLDRIPLFRIAEDYMRIIRRDREIKLTPLGALPKKVMVELYEKRHLLDDGIESGLNKLSKEADCIAISSMRHVLELAGLVKKVRGRLSLTKKGLAFMSEDQRTPLFVTFITTFTEEFNWGFNDRYNVGQIGQTAWAFSVFALQKFGDQKRTLDFYSSLVLTAFPAFLLEFTESYRPKEDQFKHCLGVRTFERFFHWFGLVQVDQKRAFFDVDSDLFWRSDALNKVFRFK